MLGSQFEELLLGQDIREREALFSKDSSEELEQCIWRLEVLTSQAFKRLRNHNRVTLALAIELRLRFKLVAH